MAVAIPHTNYFEGVLQLRNPSKALTKFVLDTVQRDNRAVITKTKTEPNGADYYLTSQKYLQILGKKIRAKFLGQFVLTSTLHTQNRMGKKLYRITILFREFSYHAGDIVTIHGDPYTVVMVGTARVCCRDETTGKKEWYKPDEITFKGKHKE